MVMKSGEFWHCVNPACGRSVLVECNSEIKEGNPRCACGSVMKKDYSPPAFHYLGFLKSPEPALAHRDSLKD
jgi:hypothetical protein